MRRLSQQLVRHKEQIARGLSLEDHFCALKRSLDGLLYSQFFSSEPFPSPSSTSSQDTFEKEEEEEEEEKMVEILVQI